MQPTGSGGRPKRSSLLSVLPVGLSVYFIIVLCVCVCILERSESRLLAVLAHFTETNRVLLLTYSGGSGLRYLHPEPLPRLAPAQV